MTSTNITVDIDLLEELAKKATPGDWQREEGLRYNDGHTYQIELVSTVWGCEEGTQEFIASCDMNAPEANARFIAAANPQTMLNLISRLRIAEAERDS